MKKYISFHANEFLSVIHFNLYGLDLFQTADMAGLDVDCDIRSLNLTKQRPPAQDPILTDRSPIFELPVGLSRRKESKDQ